MNVKNKVIGSRLLPPEEQEDNTRREERVLRQTSTVLLVSRHAVLQFGLIRSIVHHIRLVEVAVAKVVPGHLG